MTIEERNKFKMECIEKVSQNGYELQNLPAEMREDVSVCLAAISNNYDAVKYANEQFKNDSAIVMAGLDIGYYTLETVPDAVWESKAFLWNIILKYGSTSFKTLKNKSHLMPSFFWNDSSLFSMMISMDGGLDFVREYLPLVHEKLWFQINVIDSLSHRKDFNPEEIFEFIPQIETTQELESIICLFRQTQNKQNLDVCLTKLLEIMPENLKHLKADKFISEKQDAAFWLENAGSVCYHFMDENLIGVEENFSFLQKQKTKDKNKPSYTHHIHNYSLNFKNIVGIQIETIKQALETKFRQDDLPILEEFNKYLNALPIKTLTNERFVSCILDVKPTVHTKIILNRLIENYIKQDKGELFINLTLQNKLNNAIDSNLIDLSLWKNNENISKLQSMLNLNLNPMAKG